MRMVPGGGIAVRTGTTARACASGGNERGPYLIIKISEGLQYRVSNYPAFYHHYFIFVLSVILEPFSSL
jgi:hypothetical protein